MEKSGLYFHIPFCKSKCPYCDFYSVRYDEELAVRYADRIIDEIEQYQGSFDTVYFGGGTPSIIPAELLGKILDASRKHFDIDENSEITVECNPSKDLSEDFKKYASFGINRISIGMQSARNEERFALGRSAGKTQVEKAISDARRAGIENISLDLMLATPKQTLSSLDESLDFIKSCTSRLFVPFNEITSFVIISVVSSADALSSTSKFALSVFVDSISRPLYVVSIYCPVNLIVEFIDSISDFIVSDITGSISSSISTVAPAFICFKLTLFPSMFDISLDKMLFLILKLLSCNSITPLK